MFTNPHSQTLNLETFSAADIDYLRRLGFQDKDLTGLYSEQVSKGQIRPDDNNLIRLL